jgi:hypothetical protein
VDVQAHIKVTPKRPITHHIKRRTTLSNQQQENITMDASGFFKNKGTYLNASHLAAGELDVVIRSIGLERVGRDQEQKMVIYFEELTRGLTLNKTNYEALFDAFGPETDDWIERPVTLYATKTEFEGKPVDGVRLRVDPANRLPVEQRTIPKPPPIDDEIPF